MEINENLSDKAQHDYKLVKLAIETGNQKAYAELMDRYRDSVYYMLLKMVNNKDDADDLTIEAFGKAFNRLHQYVPSYAFSTWLFKIATNNCIDYIRRKKSNTFSIDTGMQNDEGGSINLDIKFDGIGPEETVIKKEKIKLMHEVVDKLKPRYKQLIELRYFEELSYEEISVRLDLPTGTVKAQLFRAREFLYNILKNSHDKI
ncbi:MAG: sigma-70 family RNA polymerase sigma factor [Bacteroidota bacterium]